MKGEQFVKMPRSLLESAAWRGLGINARRFIDFLMIEHMRQGAKRNGFLMAPRRQLWDFGIGAHFVSDAIEEVERAGLVDCKRGTGRRPSYYGLTWLPPADGSPPSNRWAVVSAVSTQNECQTALTMPVANAEQHSQRPKSSSAKQHSPSRISYHSSGRTKGDSKDSKERVVEADAAVPYSTCGFRVITPLGERTCGMVAPSGTDLCVDHARRILPV